MRAGVSTACLFPTDLEQALHHLGQHGIKLTECFFNTPSELSKESLCRLKSGAASYGMEIASVHSFHSEMETFYFFTNYKNRLEDGLELYRRYFEAAAQLGAKYLVFHGDHNYSQFAPCSEERAFHNIHALWSVGREYGVELLHENVCRCKGGHPDYLLRLHQAVPQLGFVLDCKQALRAGHSPMEFVDALGSSIRHVHISDSNAQRDCLPPGKGNCDLPQLLRALHEKGAEFSAIVELYSNSFDSLDELKESCDFVQRILDDVKKNR